MTISSKPATMLSPKDVTLRTGPPTRQELLVYYPAKFTWTQLKTFVNSGYSLDCLWTDFGLLNATISVTLVFLNEIRNFRQGTMNGP